MAVESGYHKEFRWVQLFYDVSGKAHLEISRYSLGVRQTIHRQPTFRSLLRLTDVINRGRDQSGNRKIYVYASALGWTATIWGRVTMPERRWSDGLGNED